MRAELRSIRFQLLVATVGVSLLVALLLLPLARWQVERGFDSFEIDYVEQEKRRLDVVLQEQAAALGRTAIDYSRWNDTVEYVTGTRPQWIDDNLTSDVFSNFHASLIAIADQHLRLVDVRTADGRDGHELGERLVREAALCSAALGKRDVVHRFATVDLVTYLLVCAPVMSPDEVDGPLAGVMLWAVQLDAARIEDIRGLVQFPFALQPAAISLPPTRFGTDEITTWLPVRDWDGDAAIAASLELPRPLGAQRALTTRMMLLLLVAAVAVPPLLMLALLEKLVVRRIRRVSAWVRAARLGDAGAPQLPPPIAETGFAELEMLTNDFADLTERLESARALWQAEALSDSLTGLGNRARMLGDLAPMLAERDTPVALLLIDLDGFKVVNDMMGHPAGDLLLRDVAEALRALVPAQAGCYRMGGDEFAILWSNFQRDDVENLARQLCEQVRFVRHADGKPLSVTACVGVGMRADGSGPGVSELLAQSDLALYQAKRAGRGIYRLFSAATHASYRETIELEAELGAALTQGRLVAWFQPIVDARSGQPLAVEALARWHEPVRGWIPPDRFIPLAEHSGQVLDVDLAVMGYAMRAFGAMRARHPDLHLHVNLSAQSLADDSFMRRLDALLDATGMPRDALFVELTESDLSTEPRHLELALVRLRDRGLQVVVDDFGVGASSLGRLAQVQPSAVKIDGSFVRDIHGDGGRICRAIIELTRELGIASVAEYVESEEHTQALVAMGCDALQGYGISRPLPVEATLHWLDRAPGAITTLGVLI